MSKRMKHTPGPWIADGNGFEKSYNISNADKSICDVAVSREDACLIAASPELLEQLLYVTRVLEAAIPDSTEALRHECLKIIAKARGGDSA